MLLCSICVVLCFFVLNTVHDKTIIEFGFTHDIKNHQDLGLCYPPQYSLASLANCFQCDSACINCYLIIWDLFYCTCLANSAFYFSKTTMNKIKQKSTISAGDII